MEHGEDQLGGHLAVVEVGADAPTLIQLGKLLEDPVGDVHVEGANGKDGRRGEDDVVELHRVRVVQCGAGEASVEGKEKHGEGQQHVLVVEKQNHFGQPTVVPTTVLHHQHVQELELRDREVTRVGGLGRRGMLCCGGCGCCCCFREM